MAPPGGVPDGRPCRDARPIHRPPRRRGRRAPRPSEPGDAPADPTRHPAPAARRRRRRSVPGDLRPSGRGADGGGGPARPGPQGSYADGPRPRPALPPPHGLRHHLRRAAGLARRLRRPPGRAPHLRLGAAQEGPGRPPAAEPDRGVPRRLRPGADRGDADSLPRPLRPADGGDRAGAGVARQGARPRRPRPPLGGGEAARRARRKARRHRGARHRPLVRRARLLRQPQGHPVLPLRRHRRRPLRPRRAPAALDGRARRVAPRRLRDGGAAFRPPGGERNHRRGRGGGRLLGRARLPADPPAGAAPPLPCPGGGHGRLLLQPPGAGARRRPDPLRLARGRASGRDAAPPLRPAGGLASDGARPGRRGGTGRGRDQEAGCEGEAQPHPGAGGARRDAAPAGGADAGGAAAPDPGRAQPRRRPLPRAALVAARRLRRRPRPPLRPRPRRERFRPPGEEPRRRARRHADPARDGGGDGEEAGPALRGRGRPPGPRRQPDAGAGLRAPPPRHGLHRRRPHQDRARLQCRAEADGRLGAALR